MTSLFGELRLDLTPRIAHELPQDVEGNLTLLLLLLVMHVQAKYVRCDGFVNSVLPDVTYNEDGVESGQD